jgi:hypothetical protein
MEIHIGNLPPQATVSDLNNLFGLPTNQSHCRILKKHGSDGHVFHYGLVIIRHDVTGQRLIKRFRNASLSGTRLKLRELQPRRIDNERRALNWRIKRWTGTEQRAVERRVYSKP